MDCIIALIIVNKNKHTSPDYLIEVLIQAIKFIPKTKHISIIYDVSLPSFVILLSKSIFDICSFSEMNLVG